MLDRIGGGVAVTALRQRHRLIEECPCPGDHARATHAVVAQPARGAVILRDRVSAVERIVEAAPARVRSVERVARIRQRHYELRARDGGDLVVQVGGADRKVGGLRQQIADLAQEALIRDRIDRRAYVDAMEVVDAGLQLVAQVEELPVERRKLVDQGRKPAPEFLRRHARARQCLGLDEIIERTCDRKLGDFDAMIHLAPFRCFVFLSVGLLDTALIPARRDSLSHGRGKANPSVAIPHQPSPRSGPRKERELAAIATRPRRECVGLRCRAQILLHDREPYRAARAVLFGDIAPGVLGIVTRVERSEQLLGSTDDLLETERTELSADDPEAIHGHSPGWVGCYLLGRNWQLRALELFVLG